MPQTTRTMPAVAGLLALLAAGCAAPRYQGPPVGADRVAAAREEIAARLAGGSGEASAGVPARPWAEPELRDMFARVVRAAEPLCAAERVGCRFELRLAAEAGEANAFASGERDVTLTGPLLDRLATEDQVAFVMAHELGHHLGRHLAEQAAAVGGGAAAAGVLLAVLAGAAGGDTEDAQGAFELGALVGGAGAGVRYSLSAETEADYLAAYLAARAGYDPAAGREVMLALAGLRGAGALERSFLSSHPSGPERVAANGLAAAEIAAKAARGEPLLPSPRPGPAAGAGAAR